MRKKYLLLITLLLVSIIGYACTNNTGGISLNNWENGQLSVALGDRVDLDLSDAEDSVGNKYTVTAKVEEIGGDAITVINNRFIADSLAGYKIVYSAEIKEGQTLTKTVTVTVTDSDKPIIKITGDITTIEGESFDVPTVSVIDNSGESITPTIKLYKVEDGERTEISFSGTSIVFDDGGDYVFVVTATDSSGNTATKEHEVSVVSTIYTNAVQRFNNAQELEYFDARDGSPAGRALDTGYSSAKHLYSQSSGSVYFDATGATWPNVFVSSLMSKADFVSAMEEDGAYLSIWAYFSTSTLDRVNAYVGSGSNPNITNYKTNEWQNIKITTAQLVQGLYADAAAYYDAFSTGNAALIFLYNPNGDFMRVYIDSVFVAKDATLDVEIDSDDFVVGEEIELTITSSNVDKFSLEVTAGSETRYFKGNKFTPWAIGRHDITIRSAYGSLNAVLKESIEVKGNYVLEFDDIATYFDETEEFAPTAKLIKVDDNTVVSNVEIDYVISNAVEEFEIIDGKVTLPYGEYTIYASTTYGGILMLSSLTFNVGRTAPLSGEVEHFSDKYSDATISKSSTFTRAWLSEFEDAQGTVANGVIKLGFNIQWSSLFIMPRQEKEHYSSFESIVIRMLIDDPENVLEWFRVADGSPNQIQVNTIVKGQWHDYIFPASVFVDNYDAFTQANLTGGRIVFTNGAPGTNYYVYIDSIYLTKRTTVEAGEVENFSDIGSIASIRDQQVVGISWLESFSGEDGVIKIDYAQAEADWPALRFIPRQNESDYTGYSIIRMRMYIDDPDGLISYIKLTNDWSFDTLIEGAGVVKGQWYDFDFDAAAFIQYFNDFKNVAWADNGCLVFRNTAGGNFTIYIDSITMIN